MIVSYLPEPERHPLWNGIRALLESATADGVRAVEPNELVWIAFEGNTLFGAGTTVLLNNGEAQILACGGHRHREWVNEALRIVESWARDAGASRLTMRGRRGWCRYMRPWGWDCSRDGDEWHFEKAL